ncbi:Pentalenene oxygenase [Mycobacterium marinum]|uniref:cytochrome P450 n=1 Tax=Mycobacterium marinum TaxID=1781 RepID=UPI000E3DC404|nr:cytochrome P450 [Mycobacterium marinum]RFZ55881.1 Pentalenene oxygenase [Mycobacterium marinum]
MTELVAAAAVPPAVRLPPEFRMPKALQAITYVALRRWLLLRLARRYGKVFSVNLPLYGHIVVVGDCLLAKQVLATSPEELGNIEPNLGRLFGPGSIFSLDGEEHRQRRRLLMPLFHGNLMKSYESIIEDETLREVANWPEGQSFPAMPAMAQITLGGILRALFGPECAELDELRRLVPPWVTLGLRIALLPRPRRDYGRYSPWARLAEMRHQCEIVIEKLIEAARTGPNLAERTDVLALMLRSCYDDGSAMSHNDIVDELLTMMAAGHETTAATLTWAFERLGRHPDVLAALVEEADRGGRALRQATILEVQRTRPAIDRVVRRVCSPYYRLGQWVLPQGYSVHLHIEQVQSDPEIFPDPERFDPHRHMGGKPSSLGWIPFGGGTRRCIGAALANLEIDVVLRTVLRHFTIEPNAAPDERWHNRGIAFTPKDGGQIVVHRRH